MNDVDLIVGERLRSARLASGMRQADLAQKVGVSFQQIQKYERGQNRISASRLLSIAAALGVPVEQFFEGLSPEADAPSARAGVSGLVANCPDEMCRTLIRNFMALPEVRRRAVFSIIESMSAATLAEARGRSPTG